MESFYFKDAATHAMDRGDYLQRKTGINMMWLENTVDLSAMRTRQVARELILG